MRTGPNDYVLFDHHRRIQLYREHSARYFFVVPEDRFLWSTTWKLKYQGSWQGNNIFKVDDPSALGSRIMEAFRLGAIETLDRTTYTSRRDRAKTNGDT